MSLTDIKTKNQGFTIVELLIVVVVIAILAAITIVSYNGITSRANSSAAKASAATIQKKAEIYQSETGAYPLTIATATATDFPGSDASKSWYYGGVSASFSTTALTSSSGNTTVRILKCAAAAPTPTNTQANVVASGNGSSTQTITGIRVIYWDPNKTGGAGEDSINVGNTTACPTT